MAPTQAQILPAPRPLPPAVGRAECCEFKTAANDPGCAPPTLAAAGPQLADTGEPAQAAAEGQFVGGDGSQLGQPADGQQAQQAVSQPLGMLPDQVIAIQQLDGSQPQQPMEVQPVQAGGSQPAQAFGEGQQLGQPAAQPALFQAVGAAQQAQQDASSCSLAGPGNWMACCLSKPAGVDPSCLPPRCADLSGEEPRAAGASAASSCVSKTVYTQHGMTRWAALHHATPCRRPLH